MSLKLRFKFDGRCRVHPRYNPERDGQSQHKDCPGCDSLWVIWLYTKIARRNAEAADGIMVSNGGTFQAEPDASVTEQDEPCSAVDKTLPEPPLPTDQV